MSGEISTGSFKRTKQRGVRQSAQCFFVISFFRLALSISPFGYCHIDTADFAIHQQLEFHVRLSISSSTYCFDSDAMQYMAQCPIQLFYYFIRPSHRHNTRMHPNVTGSSSFHNILLKAQCIFHFIGTRPKVWFILNLVGRPNIGIILSFEQG